MKDNALEKCMSGNSEAMEQSEAGKKRRMERERGLLLEETPSVLSGQPRQEVCTRSSGKGGSLSLAIRAVPRPSPFSQKSSEVKKSMKE